MNRTESSAAVRQALLDRHEIGLFDVRQEAWFAEAHPLFAASLPLERIELEILDRVPRLSTRVVLYDDGGGLAEAGAERLSALGYAEVSVLEGGLAGWRVSGGELFRDVNVPSKAFGELVEARRHTPSVSAEQLDVLITQHADLVILDARRTDEYQTMNIPTSISVPGGELVYRVGEIAPDPATLVVVNCAGRTRSIIGTQSLVNAGIPNRVAALRNGTIGWVLAGLVLESKQERRAPEVSAEQAAGAARRARDVADRAGVGRIGTAQLRDWRSEPDRTTYQFDVRTPDEYAELHPAGFRSAPGGQLVQETDVFAPIRGARIVLWDAAGTRADMTGSWLAQMGWDVHVLDAAIVDLEAARGPWRPQQAPASSASSTTVNERPRVYKRPYEGTDNAHAAMQAYLDWEYGLVAQLDRDGTHGFRVL